MHRKFNVATFVNIFVVGMAALTIALFVFAGRNSETREKSVGVAASVETVDEKGAPSEIAAASVVAETENIATLETETAVLSPENEVSSVAESTEVEIEAAPVAEAFESEDAELADLFAENAVSDVVLEPENEVSSVAESSDVEIEAAPVAPNAEETAELDALFAKENSNAEIAEAAPLALETSDAVSEEAGDLDALFADEVASSVEDASNVSDAEEETTEFDALFAEVETTPVADEVAPFIEEESAELDALFAGDLLTEENKEDVVAVEPEAVVEDAVAVEPEAVVEDAVAVEPEAVVEDAVAVEPEAVVEDVVVAEPETVVEDAVAVEPEAVVEDAVVAEPETVVEDAVAVEPEAVVEDAVAVEPEAVVEDAVAAEPETVVEDALAAEPEAVVEDAVAVEPEAVVEDVVVAEPEAVVEDALAVEPEAVVEDALAAEPEAVVEEVVVAEPEAVVEDVVVAEPEAVVEEVVVAEPEAVVEEVVVAEPEAVVEDALAAEPETVVEDALAAEPEAVVEDAVAAEPETVVEDALAVEPEAVAKTGVAVETNNESVLVAENLGVDVEETTVEQVADAPVLENEFWVVGQAGNGFYLYRMEAGAWVAKSVEDFATTNGAFTTIVYAHGYQTDMTDATQDAAAFKATLDAARQSVGAERPFRLVVWKWNSERDTARIRIDAQEKAFLADYSGKALGRFLGGLDPNGDLALVGFSFGARVVGSALQTLATSNVENAVVDLTFDENDDFAFAVSGAAFADSVAAVEVDAQPVAAVELAAQPVAAAEADANEANVAERKIALILVAAACDLGAFEPRGVYGRGATLPTKVLNVYNPNDFALKYYRHVSETRSDAQGVAPLRTGVFPNAVGNTFNVNSNPALGKRHNFVDAIWTVPRQTLGALAL